jgi:hypothetical protein
LDRGWVSRSDGTHNRDGNKLNAPFTAARRRIVRRRSGEKPVSRN